jgi:hypothetical protein
MKKWNLFFKIKEICEKPPRRYSFCGRYTVYTASTVNVCQKLFTNFNRANVPLWQNAPKKVGMLEFRHFHGSKNVQKKKKSFYWRGIFHLFERQKQTFFSQKNGSECQNTVWFYNHFSNPNIYEKTCQRQRQWLHWGAPLSPPQNALMLLKKCYFYCIKFIKLHYMDSFWARYFGSDKILLPSQAKSSLHGSF